MRGTREQKSIYEMTDRELRAYKRSIRRQRERRRKVMSVIAAIVLVIVCVVSYHSLITDAKSSDDVSLKYYTSVIVKSGDTLWSISDEYIDYDQYKNKAAYIEEVCSINGLSDGADIRAGQRLVVPYYSSEFVK